MWIKDILGVGKGKLPLGMGGTSPKVYSLDGVKMKGRLLLLWPRAFPAMDCFVMPLP